jgi:bifunctional ADP-heptose synthase (sugar kinase/adenylyltransferase)
MKIVVIGESCTDRYIYGDCKRLCPEGPVPVFSPLNVVEQRGMAANTFHNLENMVTHPDSVELITNFQGAHGIIKTRYIDNKTNQILLRTDENDTCNGIGRLMDRVESMSKGDYKIEKCDVVVVSDYCKGLLSNQDLVDIGNMFELSVLDTKRPLTQSVLDAYNFIKLNEHEFEQNDELVLTSYSLDKCIITLGARGVKFLNDIFPPPKEIQTFDVSGAGDVFTAAFSYSVAGGFSVSDSIATAQNCCTKVIQHRGTCVYKKEMEE